MNKNALFKSFLQNNCCYKKGDSIVLVEQIAPKKCPQAFKKKFQGSHDFCMQFLAFCRQNKIPIEHVSYIPKDLRNGAEAPPSIIKKQYDLAILPTAFSLTHTKFRKSFGKVTRVASMPGFAMHMLPTVQANAKLLQKLTNTYARKMKQHKYARITGPKTDMYIVINQKLVLTSNGILNSPGKCENIPGAEAFCVPVTGKSYGYFTVPKGFGGQIGLPCEATFVVEKGCIVDVCCPKKYVAFFAEKIVPTLQPKDYNVLAEFGIGTNPYITPKFVLKHGWSTLLGEKIFGTAHFAHGNSKGMGGSNDVPVHIDYVIPKVTIRFSNK